MKKFKVLESAKPDRLTDFKDATINLTDNFEDVKIVELQKGKSGFEVKDKFHTCCGYAIHIENYFWDAPQISFMGRSVVELDDKRIEILSTITRLKSHGFDVRVDDGFEVIVVIL